MRPLFCIAEAGSTWDCDLKKAFQLIDAAKACGANAVKFQYTSNAEAMALRRKAPQAADMYTKYLQYPVEYLFDLKDHCDKVGVEFMVTVYLPEDIPTVSSLVKRFKISAYESMDDDFVRRHVRYDKEIIVSVNPSYVPMPRASRLKQIKLLHCISKYPTELKDLGLSRIMRHDLDGLSDHTANVLTGAAAVAGGAGIVESHIRLESTMPYNPDYEHSLSADGVNGVNYEYGLYVKNIRTVEIMR